MNLDLNFDVSLLEGIIVKRRNCFIIEVELDGTF